MLGVVAGRMKEVDWLFTRPRGGLMCVRSCGRKNEGSRLALY